MDRRFLPGDIVRHFKREIDSENNHYLYRILGTAIHSETKEVFMVYQGLYTPFATYIRPYEMFCSKVDKEKYPDIKQEYRFETITENV